MSGNYTEEDLQTAADAAVAKALAPYQDAQALETLAAAIEESNAPFVAKITELQNTVDTATLRADTAEANYNALVALLEEAKAAEIAAAELAVKREERKEAVKELSFTEEHVEAKLDRWVAMNDEDFAELLEGWKAVASKKTDGVVDTTPTVIPTTTAMKASREDNQGERYAGQAAIREVALLGRRGEDIRKL